jgi:hypothetical protein
LTLGPTVHEGLVPFNCTVSTALFDFRGTYRVDQHIIRDLNSRREDLSTNNIHGVLAGDVDSIVAPPRSGRPGSDEREKREKGEESGELPRHLATSASCGWGGEIGRSLVERCVLACSGKE